MKFLEPNHIAGYMNRWWVLRLGRSDAKNSTGRPTGKLNVRIHHILTSDDVAGLHDHPFWFISVVLWGGYWEHYYHNNIVGSVIVKRWRGPGSIAFSPAERAHRVELPEGRTSWSLFIFGPYKRKWGFWLNSIAGRRTIKPTWVPGIGVRPNQPQEK